MIELRRWTGSDVPAVHAAHGGTIDQATAWVRSQRQRPSAVGISCAIAPCGKTAVGYVGLIRRPRVELGARLAISEDVLAFQAHQQIAGIGFWIAPDRQREGLATRAVRLLSRWALQSGGLIRIEALVEPNNQASKRVVEKSGFHPEGHLRRYLQLDGSPADALAYSLLRSDL